MSIVCVAVTATYHGKAAGGFSLSSARSARVAFVENVVGRCAMYLPANLCGSSGPVADDHL